jgi:hypothetical protein
MPYQLEKGPYFSVTESVFEDLATRIHVLIRLRNGEDPNTMPTVESTSLDPAHGGVDTHRERLDHQNLHWYGRRESPPYSNHWIDQKPFDSVTNPTTGYWHNWYGNAEKIVSETYTRAIEVSLGIPHDPTMKDYGWIHQHKTRQWPIEVFNRCPAPWFEGWVTWRGHTSGNGHVTVHLLTPSHVDSNLIHSPFRQTTTPEYKDERTGVSLASDGERGMWVVTHEKQDVVKPPGGAFGLLSSVVGSGDDWTVPWFGGHVWSHDDNVQRTSDKIVVVQPNEPDGGVLAAGRPYQP